MKRISENNFRLFFYQFCLVSSFLLLFATIKPASGTSLLQVGKEDKENYKENEIKNGMGNVTDHLDSLSGYPGNLLLILNSCQSEMIELTGRLSKLEITVVVLNDRVVYQEKEINALKSKRKREKRQTNALLQCTKIPCAFDFPKNVLTTIAGSANTQSEKLPRSCNDLKKLGHTLNGIYHVQGSDVNANKIALVFCQFSLSSAVGNVIPEKKLGFVDIRSMPNRVAFFAHRNYPLWPGSLSIDFYLLKLNEGGALNVSTGIFTPPVNGTYAFHFRGLAKQGVVKVDLYHNDFFVTSSYFDGSSLHGHLVLSAVLKLTTGDNVKLHQSGSGFLQDNGVHTTTFSGWLLEEDLSF